MMRDNDDIAMMVEFFPHCPICGSEGNYTMKSLGKIQCESCRARFLPTRQLRPDSLRKGHEFKFMTLVKVGKIKNAKHIYGRIKTIEFWRNYDAQTYPPSFEKDIEELLRNISFHISLVFHNGQILEPNLVYREEILNKLRAFGELGLSEIRGIAKGENISNYRRLALYVLSHLGDESDYAIIERAREENIEDDKRMLASIYLTLYNKTGNGEYLLPVFEELRSAPTAEQRASIAYELGSIKENKSVIHALARALHDRSAPSQGPITAGSVFGAVKASMKLPQPIVYQFAATSLEKIGQPEAIKALIDYELNNNLNRFKERVKYIASIGPVAVDPLLTWLQSKNLNAVSYAIGYLGFIGDLRAVDPLIDLLIHDHEDIRRVAAIYLGVLGDNKAIEPLNSLLDDENEIVNKAAQEAIDKIRAK